MYTGISFDDFVYIIKSGYAYETKMHISDFVEKYDFDALLCYITEPMSYYYLEHQDEYELLYKDETCLFAVKKGKE